MKVNVIEKSIEYQGFFTLEKSTLQFEKQDGRLSKQVVRENFYRGDSVAALVYDLKEKLVLLVRQFRYPVYTIEPEKAWILELVAGSCDRQENPIDTMARELKEEVHVDADPSSLENFGSFFVSPGGTSEQLYLYGCETDLSQYKHKHGGLENENEDIEIVLMGFRDAFLLLDNKNIFDAKTIIALQQLKLTKQSQL